MLYTSLSIIFKIYEINKSGVKIILFIMIKKNYDELVIDRNLISVMFRPISSTLCVYKRLIIIICRKK